MTAGTTDRGPSSDRLDRQPRWPTATVRTRHGYPYCDECGRRIADARQHRCPWLSCRRWFRGTDTPPPVNARQRAKTEQANN